jgi:ubiquinone/menaquinone biosynthesis C-methylase UbiE
MKSLHDSWNSFSPEMAEKYLKTFGHPSLTSKELLWEVLHSLGRGKKLKIVDLGCGNANMAEYLQSKGMDFSYTGVDASEELLKVAASALTEVDFVQDDLCKLSKVGGQFDVALYSHVLEILSSPEESLLAARNMAKKIVIRFFEPPEHEADVTELRWMDVGQADPVPYLRRKMSRDFYRLVLSRIKCRQVDVFRDVSSRDQVHVLHF